MLSLNRPLTEESTKRAKEIRDFLLYIGAALLVVGSILIYAEHSPADAEFPSWIWLAAITAITWAYLAQAFRRSWRNWKFWIFYVGMLGLHVFAWRVLLSHWQSRFLFGSTLIVSVEFTLLCVIADQIVTL